MNSLPLNELIKMNASGTSHRSESSVRKSVSTALPGEKRGRETAGIGAFAAASDGMFAVPDAERAASLLVALTGRPPSNG